MKDTACMVDINSLRDQCLNVECGSQSDLIDICGVDLVV